MFFYTFLTKQLNMSLTASVVIGLVLLLRLFLKARRLSHMHFGELSFFD